MIAPQRSLSLSQESLEETLDCYLPNVRYLRAARVTHAEGFLPFECDVGSCVAVADGEFVAQPPWYIRDTGHFNSIEFNICYNQLAFVLIRYCVDMGLDSTLSDYIPKEEFVQRMLPSVLILRYSVAFERPMRAARFSGRLGILKVVNKMRRLFLQTRLWVGRESSNWCSRGEVTLAVVRSAPVVFDITHSIVDKDCARGSLV